MGRSFEGMSVNPLRFSLILTHFEFQTIYKFFSCKDWSFLKLFKYVSVRPYHVELIRRDYVANGGWET